MTAIFKADENETKEKYSVSEWWLEPKSDGPGKHLHEDNDEVFYVLEGITTFFVGDKWIDADKGTFLRIPANTIHDFKNKTDQKTGILTFLYLVVLKEVCRQLCNGLKKINKRSTLK